MHISHTAGMIIAANKKVARPLMQVGAISVIRRIVITFQQTGVFPIVIITGPEEYEIRHQLAGHGVVFIQYQESDEPELLDSIKTGLEYLKDKCERVAITPVNVPMFTPSTLETLLESKDKVVAPSFEGRGGHPIVMSTDIADQIISYSGDNGLRGALSAAGYERSWAEVEDRGVVLTVNNVEELEEQLDDHNRTILHPVVNMRMEREEPFFNTRLKLLLYLLKDTPNIRYCCEASGLAYSKAWEMINNLEDNLGYSVVERRRGGAGGGQTVLTDKGEEFLRAYQKFEEHIHQETQREFRKRFAETGIIT